MSDVADRRFDDGVWTPALESFGAVTQLTVELYDDDGRRVCGPASVTSLFSMFQEHGYDPGLFADCARECLTQTRDDRTPVVLTLSSGLAVVGVSLVLDDRPVAALVAGYAMIGFSESVAIGRLARACGVPFPQLWALTRRQKPVPTSRLRLHGQLLRVLGDAVLRENDLRRHAEYTAQQLAHLAHHDALTNLPNRALLAERLGRALALAARHHRHLAVLFVDVDRFKHVNDSLGHQVGDELLRVVGRELTRCVRDSDTVARQGGDEFIIVLSELTHPQDAATVARTVISALDQPHHLAGHELRIAVSIGVSVFPTDGDEPEALLKHADMALYSAKELGRGQWRFFEPSLNIRAIERRVIEAGLARALAQHEFELFYQPKVQLQTGAIVGVEALIRWRHPERGLVAPGEFVPVAEACGLIRPIGSWVLHEACRQAQAWRASGLRPTKVAVNVSAIEFQGNELLKKVVDALTATGLDPRYLELELTEGVLMPQGFDIFGVLHALKGLGVQLAIDDFGVGWSSLSYLTQFPIDALKIDRSFVQQIVPGATAAHGASAVAPIVKAVISMGKSLDLRVVAEGVETREQLTFLQAEACAEGQGYYFGRPMAAEQCTEVLERGIVIDLGGWAGAHEHASD
jgi:diguanylate cyclase (GGDEF)-like protein